MNNNNNCVINDLQARRSESLKGQLRTDNNNLSAQLQFDFTLTTDKATTIYGVSVFNQNTIITKIKRNLLP